MLWFIERHPDLPVGGNPEMRIMAQLNAGGYAKAKRLWLTKIEKHRENPLVLANAAKFFLLPERSIAEDLLLRAQKLDPHNPTWYERLGHLYRLSIHREDAARRREIASRSLEQFERCLAFQTDARFADALLPDLARAALEAGEDVKAEQYAARALAASQESGRNWNRGNLIHHAHLVLGRLALKAGDIEKAKARLLGSGRTPGSPQLDSFGPNMTLAKELLEQGEKAAVLEYFDLCRKFWSAERLNRWSEAVANDQMPDFEGNLRY
ncbi:MAG: tetratricopeptide repeat protein [Aureliella sp.]